MRRLMNMGAAGLFLCLLATAPVGAACIKFEENKLGDAYLINSCPMAMNVAYCVNGKNSKKDCGQGFSHLPIAARSRKLLWPGTKPPAPGTYQINVLSCPAPSTLVIQDGSPPSCRVDSADAG